MLLNCGVGERLKAGGEGDDIGWDGWITSPTQWTWVWINSGSWWWTGRPGMLRFMASQRVRHNWATELNWYTLLMIRLSLCIILLKYHRSSNVQHSHCIISEGTFISTWLTIGYANHVHLLKWQISMKLLLFIR